MDIETLRLFRDVATRLSFAAVAEDRMVNPSSVSRSIAALEQELGVRLFQRTTRRMVLTDEGESFLNRIEPAVADIDRAIEGVQGEVSGVSGTVRLTVSVAYGQVKLLPLLDEIRSTFPALKLEILLSDDNLDLVGDGVDLALRLGSEIKGDVIASRVAPTRYRVCASPAYLARSNRIRAPGDLADHRCLLLTLPEFRSRWIFRLQAGEDIGVDIAGNIAISSALGLRQAARDGLGPALLADWLVEDDLASCALVDLFPDVQVTATTFETAVWLVYPSRRHQPMRVRALLEFLRKRMR